MDNRVLADLEPLETCDILLGCIGDGSTTVYETVLQSSVGVNVQVCQHRP